MKIRLEIRRKQGGKAIGNVITKDLNINLKKPSDAKKQAELRFLNEYINRDIEEKFKMEYTEIKHARSLVELQIKAYVITEKCKS